MTHELKIEKQWADAKLAGEMPFGIRRNDRGFQKGDRVKYTVVDPKTHEKMWFDFGDGCGQQCHALEKCEFEITYVREGAENGLQPGYCVFADRPVPVVGKGIPAGEYGSPDIGVTTGTPKEHYAYRTVTSVNVASHVPGPGKPKDAPPADSLWGLASPTVLTKNGTVIGPDNYRPEPGDSDEVLDAKLEFYRANGITVADDILLRHVSKRDSETVVR